MFFRRILYSSMKQLREHTTVLEHAAHVARI